MTFVDKQLCKWCYFALKNFSGYHQKCKGRNNCQCTKHRTKDPFYLTYHDVDYRVQVT
jgi:hypothetical protein